MRQTEVRPSSQPETGRRGGARRRVVRVAVAGIIVVGALGVAAPSWAGPLMGC